MTFKYQGTRDNGTPRYEVWQEGTSNYFGLVQRADAERQYVFVSAIPFGKRLNADMLSEIANFCKTETERNQ